MKIKKSIAGLAVILYIALIYFSPSQYIDKPKFIFLYIAKLPLNLTHTLFRNVNSLAHSRDMMQENRCLHETVGALTLQLSQYKEVEQENARLRELLNFKKASASKLVAAGIIARDSSNFSDTIVINQGHKQKIRIDTVVVAEAGLVGRVYEGSPSMSRVILVTDPNSRVSALCSRSRQIGVVYGTSSNLCELRYLPLAADIVVGDEIVTSGFSDIYPKGILIGKVIKIVRESRGLSLTAIVSPAVNFASLEEVLCIE